MFAPPICWSPTAPIWCWRLPSAAPRMRRQTAHGSQRRARRPGRGTGSSGGRGTGKIIRASNTFPKLGEDNYHSFLGVPLIDRGVLQGVLVVQTVEARVFPENEIRQLTEAATRVAHVVSEARTLDRFIAPVQERLWAWRATCGGVGITIPRAFSAISIRCAGVSSITVRSRC
jgi:hypothetical protein